MAQREGYLIVDHQASPGLPPELAAQMGYDPALCKEGKVFEAATLTCAHCKTVVVKNPDRLRARGSCVKCSNKYLCDDCTVAARQPDYTHMPYEKLRDLTMEGKAPTALLMTGPRQTPSPGLILPPHQL